MDRPEILNSETFKDALSKYAEVVVHPQTLKELIEYTEHLEKRLNCAHIGKPTQTAEFKRG